MEFKYFNPNPDAATFKDGKPKGWNRKDSAIRAICGAIQKPWNTVFKLLSSIALKHHDMADSKTVVNDFCLEHGFTYETFGKPTIGTKRPTIIEFATMHPQGIYVLYLRDYYTCMDNGVLLDVKPIGDEPVYSFWKSIKS